MATPPANESTIRLEDHDDDDLTQTLGNDFETNRRYLAFSWWLLHRGWKQLMNEVQTAVTEVFGPLNPREDISLARLSELFLEVRKRVEGYTEEERKYVSSYPHSQPNFLLTVPADTGSGCLICSLLAKRRTKY